MHAIHTQAEVKYEEVEYEQFCEDALLFVELLQTRNIRFSSSISNSCFKFLNNNSSKIFVLKFKFELKKNQQQ